MFLVYKSFPFLSLHLKFVFPFTVLQGRLCFHFYKYLHLYKTVFLYSFTNYFTFTKSSFGLCSYYYVLVFVFSHSFLFILQILQKPFLFFYFIFIRSISVFVLALKLYVWCDTCFLSCRNLNTTKLSCNIIFHTCIHVWIF